MRGGEEHVGEQIRSLIISKTVSRCGAVVGV